MRATSRFPVVVFVLACLGTTGGVSRGAIVMNQIGTAATYDFNVAPGPSPSQIFTDFPLFDCAVIEDFTVTSDELKVTHVSALFRAQGGFLGFQGVESYALNIFSDANLAGTSLFGDIASVIVVGGAGAAVSQIIDGGGGGEYGLVSLDVNISLPTAGTYWLGVSPKSNSAETGQFLLMNNGATGSVTVGNSNAKLANPGGGFGGGTLVSLNRDYAYSVTAVPEPAVPALWIISGAGILIRRRRLRPLPQQIGKRR